MKMLSFNHNIFYNYNFIFVICLNKKLQYIFYNNIYDYLSLLFMKLYISIINFILGKNIMIFHH